MINVKKAFIVWKELVELNNHLIPMNPMLEKDMIKIIPIIKENHP